MVCTNRSNNRPYFGANDPKTVKDRHTVNPYHLNGKELPLLPRESYKHSSLTTAPDSYKGR